MTQKPRLIVVTGPTASGKTSFSVSLAKILGGEIVNADSMLVYRGLDIGTAKPTDSERAGVPHHLIDIVDIGELYHVGRFREDATRAITDISARGGVPLVVGGTALYIKVLLEGLAEGPGRDEEIRASLDARWDAGERAELFAELAKADPMTAARLHANDRTRIIRALEIWLSTGARASEARAAHGFSERPFDSLRIGMEMPRDLLYERINARVDAMIAGGLVEEVRGVLARGFAPDLAPLKSIGYAQICRHLAGGEPLDAMVEEAKKATRHFARRQMTWMRKFDLVWLKPSQLAEAADMAKVFLSR